MVQTPVTPNESQQLGRGRRRTGQPEGNYYTTVSIADEDWVVTLSRQREEFELLIGQLTETEVREMLLDLLVASCAAISEWRVDHLMNELNSWLATAEVIVETRDDKDEIIRARQEALSEITDSRSVHDK